MTPHSGRRVFGPAVHCSECGELCDDSLAVTVALGERPEPKRLSFCSLKCCFHNGAALVREQRLQSIERRLRALETICELKVVSELHGLREQKGKKRK